MKTRFVPAAALAAVLVSAGAAQTTRLVPSQYPTIQAAIAVSVNGDTVLVSPGSHVGPINFLGKAIHVQSVGGAATTTIVGMQGARVVSFVANEAPTSTLTGFTITGGGGGIICQDSSPLVQNCRIAGNSVTPVSGPIYAPPQTFGGGVYCAATTGVSAPVFSGCVIENNSAWEGGGFYAEGGPNLLPTLIGCRINNNTAVGGQSCSGSACTPYQGRGAGACFKGTGCSPSISGSTIRDNAGAGDGGGLAFAATGAVSVSDCTIAGNISLGGSGGISCSASQMLLTNSVLTGNACHTATGYGAAGALAVGGLTATTIRACTIARNHTFGLGGGVVLSLGGSSVTITSSILWGNDVFDLQNIGAVSPAVSFSDIGVGTYPAGTGNLSADPLFLDAAGGDLHLSTGSPCRDTGTPNTAGLPANDLDGTPRIVGSVVDMGADEIPALAYPGTADGLDLHAWINGAGDPLASTRPGVAGDLLTLTMRSSTGSLVGGLPILGARVFTTGSPPAQPPGFPAIWLDAGTTIFYGTLAAPPFGFPGLPVAGLTFQFTIPAGLAGMSVRVQGLVSSLNALNGIYATTNATEVTF